jgi:hypothetical protein
MGNRAAPGRRLSSGARSRPTPGTDDERELLLVDLHLE